MPDNPWRTNFFTLRDWCLDAGYPLPNWAMEDIVKLAGKIKGTLDDKSDIRLTTGHPPPAPTTCGREKS